MFGPQLGFTDDIDPALSLKLISESALAFLNRHLPLTEAQRSLFRQSQAGPDATPQSHASPIADGHVATLSQHMPDAQHQGRDNSNHHQIDADANRGVATHNSSFQAGQVVLEDLPDRTNDGTALSGRTYESRVKPEEREVFETICNGNIAILELAL